MQNKINLYEETKKRVIRCKHNRNISDKEIIEELAIEIQQYRKRIESLNNAIDELLEEQKETEEDTDIEIIESITRYADNKPIEQITKYKYKEDNKNG